MNQGQCATQAVHGCILLIPSKLFQALACEAAREQVSPEAFLLRLLERRVEQTTQAERNGRHG
jgi:hypothetical protein